MFTYKENFSSKRTDGRHLSTFAGFMENLRHWKPELALPEKLTPELFREWQKKVTEKCIELMQMPEFTEQPEPVLLNTVQREGYRVEKWEFYPDDYTAVPFLILIPDIASAAHPVPGVICLLGSNWSKEFAAGEPLLDHPNCQFSKFPERNVMGPSFVKAGMAAFIFDNPEIGECSLQDPAVDWDTSGSTRKQLCHGLLHAGFNYLGLTVFQKLCVWRSMRKLDYIDHKRWAVASHSLGTEAAVILGLLIPEIKAVVFNDNVHDDRIRYVAVTEEDVTQMHHDIGNWHVVPGILRYFSFQDMCAALAPKYLALTEGGAAEQLEVVRRAYNVLDVPDHLAVTHYPAFQDPGKRKNSGKIPRFGLTFEELYNEWMYCDAPDHSFRMAPALKHIQAAFAREE